VSSLFPVVGDGVLITFSVQVATKHNEEWIFYNGITHDDIQNTGKMGMEAWAKHGIGRQCLIPYPARRLLTFNQLAEVYYWMFGII
jgi:hypothetical protein